MILLTDEEISLALRNQGYTDEVHAELQVVAEAQLKKVNDWAYEDCPHHAVTRRKDKPLHRKRECSICWQALSEEVKVSGDNDH